MNNSIIEIDGDASTYNWFWAVNQSWCSGSGTWSDPYVIKNLNIDGNGSLNCIIIRDSSFYFRIENSSFYNLKNLIGTGIRLENVQNGVLYKNKLSSLNYNGIYMKNCEEIKILENNFTQCIDSVSIENSYNITLSNNSMYKCGISVSGSLNQLTSYFIDNSNLVNEKPIYYYINKKCLEKTNFTNPGQIILVNCSNSIIKELDFLKDSAGISLFYCTKYQIYKNNISGIKNGITLRHCFNVNISLNHIFQNKGNGIMLYASDNCFISENIMKWNQLDGIEMLESLSNVIIRNNIDSNYNGIKLITSPNNDILNNSLLNNRVHGIYIEYTSNKNEISRNIVLNNKINGISLRYSRSNIIIGNEVKNNNKNGIELYNSDENEILGNIILNNRIDGIALYSYNDDNTIIQNLIKCNDNAGIALYSYNDNNIIAENDIHSNYNYGIYLKSASYNTISENIIQFNCFYGIYLLDSSDNIITKNKVKYNEIGLFLDESDYNIISTNEFIANEENLIEEDSEGNEFENNIGIPDSDSNEPDNTFWIVLKRIILILTLIIYIFGFILLIYIKLKKQKLNRNETEKSEIDEKMKSTDLNEKNSRLSSLHIYHTNVKDNNYKVSYCPYCGSNID